MTMETSEKIFMPRSDRFFGFIAYLLPVIGWIYLIIFQRKNHFAQFHLRQAVGLFLFVILVILGWGIVAWLLSWIPYAVIFGMALFSLPLTAVIFGVVAWIIGLVNSLLDREEPLPIIGGFSSRLPI